MWKDGDRVEKKRGRSTWRKCNVREEDIYIYIVCIFFSFFEEEESTTKGRISSSAQVL